MRIIRSKRRNQSSTLYRTITIMMTQLQNNCVDNINTGYIKKYLGLKLIYSKQKSAHFLA